MTEQGAVPAAEPVRVGRSSLLALTTAVAGSAICAVVTMLLVAPRFLPDRFLPTFTLADERQLIAMAVGFVGALLALIGLVAGVVVLSATGRSGGRRRAVWALALGIAGPTLVGFTWWFVNQPPYLRYGLKELPAAQRARLDGLDPAAAVTIYLTARDLSVDYWLSDEQTLRLWHNASWDPAAWEHCPPWGVLAGVDDLRVTPLKDSDHPATDSQLSFSVTCTARGTGEHEEYFFVVTRASGGPWRVEEIQFP